MTSLIDSITNPLKTAGETAQKLISLRDTAKFGDAIIELQAQIMAAQHGALAAQAREAAMAEEIRGLKTRMAELEAWDAEKQRYELTDFGSGTFAYALKPSMCGAEPPHRICEACYQKGHKSILQFQFKVATGQDKYACPACKTEFDLGEYRDPPVIHPRGPSYSRTDR